MGNEMLRLEPREKKTRFRKLLRNRQINGCL